MVSLQNKVFEELYEIFEDSERSVTCDDLAQMKYLERVIKETMRLFPVGNILARTLTGDIVLRK